MGKIWHKQWYRLIVKEEIMSDFDGPVDENGKKVDFMTEFGLYTGELKQFPNKTVISKPSQHLTYNVMKSLDKVSEKYEYQHSWNKKDKYGNAGCWGKKK